MNTFRRILSVLMFFAVLAHCDAQNITINYFYDECGNRILRCIGFKKTEDKQSVKNVSENDYWLTETNDSIADFRLFLYPNPTFDGFTLFISGMTTEKIHAVLYTMNGCVIEERIITKTNESFDLSHKAAGIYLLRLHTAYETQTWKIIKK